MNLQKRIEILAETGRYLQANPAPWQEAKERAGFANNWFTPEFIDLAVANICRHFLQQEELQNWARHYHLDDNVVPKNVGLVMAGNIPLVGFHDLLTIFISGHRQTIKLSSKDEVLIKEMVNRMTELEPAAADFISFAETLKSCDAYIATGSSNTARYFDYYFSKYPSIIRRNRTSVAILTGKESAEELSLLADDIQLYFGLGCRNVTKIYVPADYDFVPLLKALEKYSYFADHHKYKNNFDYQLSLALLNKVFYMTNNSILLLESENLFSPISCLFYSTYTDAGELRATLEQNTEVQCIVGPYGVAFGQAQSPRLTDYADGVDTLQFLLGL
ncbi:MAG: acyl-CoA reductase [Ferruginibacter sp.]